MYTKYIKTLSVIIAIAVFLAAIPATLSAAEAIGSRIEIEKIDGTAYIVKSSGKKTEARAGVKLSAKESLQTTMGSYAFLGIDDDKVIKVDELSQINIAKKNNKLSVNIEEGSIMFEVKGKIPQTCEMDLNASTMAMSIRGTAGIIGLRRIGDNIVSVADLVDGKVNMTYRDISGKGQTFTLWGGESSLHKDGSDSVERDLIDVTEFPGFAAVELAQNPDLCANMLEKSGLNTKWPIEHADELLKRGQAYNRENYYDVFEPGNVHSVASLKGYVDSVMNLALTKEPDEPVMTPYPVEEDITPAKTIATERPKKKEPTPVDENRKKYGQPIATATPTPVGYKGPNTISWEEYVNKYREKDTDNEGNRVHRNDNNTDGINTRVEPRPVSNYDNINYPNVLNSSSSYNNPVSANNESGGDSDEDPYSDKKEKKKTSTPTPTPEPTKEPTSTTTPTPEPTKEPTSTPTPTPEPGEDEFLVRFFDPKDDVPTQPIKEMYVKRSGFATPPDDPVHKGFRFTGWDPYVQGREIFEDTNFYATYEEETLEVTFRVVDDVSTLSKRYVGETDDPWNEIPLEDYQYIDLSGFVHVVDDNTITIDKEAVKHAGLPDCYFRPSFTRGGYSRILPVYSLEEALDKLEEDYSEYGNRSDSKTIVFELFPYYRVRIIDSEGENVAEYKYGTVIKLNAASKDGYKFSHWESTDNSVYLDGFTREYKYKVNNHNVVIEAVYAEDSTTQKYSVKFYRMLGGPDDYDTVELLGAIDVDKGADVSTQLNQYEQMVREQKGGMTIVKINKGSYKNVTMDLDIYIY